MQRQMEYIETEPCKKLKPFIHFYWELKGAELEERRERVFPDGCAGILISLGNTCLTDNGSISLELGKTYIVGAMTTFKESFIERDTHLIGVCLKPATFSNFYKDASQDFLTNDTVEFEKSNAFNFDKILNSPFDYLNHFFSDRLRTEYKPLQTVINDIHSSNGLCSVQELSQRNCTTVRHLERMFKKFVGLSPKAYSNIIRFQNALNIIKNSANNRSFLDIAFECGYYDHAHLSNQIKRHTGLSPSQIKLSHFYKV